MGSEQIHYEALRKQSIMDKRSSLNIRRIVKIKLIFYLKRDQ